MKATGHNHSLIIEASAGSGKTYQLVNRLIQLLINGANPANIVAITFTRKAATEMQARLQDRLCELATNDEETAKKNLKDSGISDSTANLSKARYLYEQVVLSPQTIRCTTFHSFCQEILKRFPFEADVPPGFELTEQTYLYKQQAWHALMAECEQNPNNSVTEAIAFLFEEFGLYNTNEILNSFLNQRGDWWAWTHKANNPVGMAISLMQKNFDVDLNDKPLETFFNTKDLEKTLSEFCNSLNKLKAAKYKIWLQELGFVRDTNLSIDDRYKYLKSAFFTQTGKPRALTIAKANEKLFSESELIQFPQSHIDICKNIEQLDDKLNLLNNYKINKHWYIAGAAYLEHYQNIKLSLRLLDFTDLEWQTYNLLTKSQHAFWIQYKLDARINHLLIDEFQDTNPIQWRLLQPLIEEFSHQNTSSDNSRSVLLVGDTKQSIYRFRRAEPKLFSIAGKHIKENFPCKKMQLNASWRSSPAIISFVNNIFLNTHLSNVIEDFPVHKTEKTNLPGSVTLLGYPEETHTNKPEEEQSIPFRNPLEQPREEKQSPNQLEADIIATKITEIINSKLPITDKPNVREAQYKDIIILIRNRTNASCYEQALHKHSIPYIGSERGTLLDCLEVNDMIMLLNWLITPFNNIALASILRSPLFSVSDHALIQLAQIKNTETGHSNWFEKIETCLQHEKDTKLEYAFNTLSRWLSIATQIPVHDLLDVIFNEADVIKQYQLAYPKHLKSRVQSNLTRLIELALEVDSGRYPSLQQFIAHIENLRSLQEDAPDTPAAGSDMDRVQVMTIHASKGLEAPIIFLANADTEGKPNYTYKSIVDWPAEKETPNLMLLSSTTKKRDSITNAMLEIDSTTQQRESANLFYVALTRAKQYLFISAAKQTKSNSDWYTLIQNCYNVKTEDSKSESILETCVLDSTEVIKTDIKSDTNSNNIKADPRYKKRIELTTIYQDIQQTISPSQSLPKDLPTIKQQNVYDTDATQRGIIIHSILEHICNKPGSTEKQLQQKTGFNVSPSLWKQCWEEANAVLKTDSFSFVFSKDAQGYNEVPVSYLLDSVTVYGIIDRVSIFNNEVHIVDYKTNRVVTENNISEYAEYYKPQLMHYQHAASKIWPDHTVKSHLLFTHNKLLHTYE